MHPMQQSQQIIEMEIKICILNPTSQNILSCDKTIKSFSYKFWGEKIPEKKKNQTTLYLSSWVFLNHKSVTAC